MKEKIHFIINSRSSKAKVRLANELEANPYWKDNFDWYLWDSQYKGHALELAQKAILDESKLVIACGGDGTINEIGRYLIETEIPLGIIPMGSGNGLARHFKIPLTIKTALQVIQNQNLIEMNAGLANQHFFLSNMGVTFDAQFIQAYQKIASRGFIAYFKSLCDALRSFKIQKLIISYETKSREVFPFLLMISNTNQFGYNFSLTPRASVIDGKLELIIFKSNSIFALLKLFLSSLFKIKLSDELLEVVPVTETIITNESQEFLFQLDGEINYTSSSEILVKIHPRTLKIVVPKL
tara:strand:+ start:2605 stop:3492 length:888 start_codon:yes stop_codon:yes gene_type:complete